MAFFCGFEALLLLWLLIEEEDNWSHEDERKSKAQKADILKGKSH